MSDYAGMSDEQILAELDRKYGSGGEPVEPMTDEQIVEHAVAMADANGLVLDDAGRVCWERTIERIEREVGRPLGDELDSPLERRVKRAVQRARSEG